MRTWNEHRAAVNVLRELWSELWHYSQQGFILTAHRNLNWSTDLICEFWKISINPLLFITVQAEMEFIFGFASWVSGLHIHIKALFFWDRFFKDKLDEIQLQYALFFAHKHAKIPISLRHKAVSSYHPSPLWNTP